MAQTICLKTIINADIETVFDLSRSIDAHKASASTSGEHVVSGRDSGLAELGDRIRWRARHFGLWLELEVEITELTFPESFRDEMIDGNFKKMVHTHTFKEVVPGVTEMKDEFCFSSPFGLLGGVVDHLVMKRYLTGFLLERNAYLKAAAERVE